VFAPEMIRELQLQNCREVVAVNIPKEIVFAPEMLRELQLIQLECLIEADRVCRKHGIEYSIDGGTLLGAVRHKGFIPWDDDIDVIMSRSEYERFFEICRKELDTTRFFLQEHRTDSYYRVAFPRLKRKGTIYIRAGQEGSKQHNGVQIDISVLDNMPGGYLAKRLHRGLAFFFRKILWSRTGKAVSKSSIVRMAYALLDIFPAKLAFWGFDALARRCNRRPSKLVRHYGMTYPNPKINGYGIPADLLDSFAELEFEGYKFKSIAAYDRYLTLLYGDYMEMPPEDERKPRICLSAFEGVKDTNSNQLRLTTDI
jgi:lipopolysaccharide cholinephosphotransferase